MLARHIFEQDRPPCSLPQSSVHFAVASFSPPWLGGSRLWRLSTFGSFTSDSFGSGGFPACMIVKCLSLWHSTHFTVLRQSFATWVVEATQRKHIRFFLSRFFLSSSDFPRKALHLARGCAFSWRTHHLLGSQVTFFLRLSSSSAISVLYVCLCFEPEFLNWWFSLSRTSKVKFGSFLSSARFCTNFENSSKGGYSTPWSVL